MYVYTTLCSSVQLSVDFVCLYLSASVNYAAMNTGAQVNMWNPAFSSWGTGLEVALLNCTKNKLLPYF